jgi:arsenate reductase (glutaredoxin)
VELIKHDLAKEPPSRELLERLIDESHLDDFFNKRSPAYKERGLDGRTLTKKQAIDLMMEEPNLIRRPLVLAKGKAVFGYKPEEYESLLKR